MAIWSDKNIKEARILLNLRFDDAPYLPETIQEMVSILITEFRNDPKEIERAILNHWKKKK
jgi:hypothetical protein